MQALVKLHTDNPIIFNLTELQKKLGDKYITDWACDRAWLLRLFCKQIHTLDSDDDVRRIILGKAITTN